MVAVLLCCMHRVLDEDLLAVCAVDFSVTSEVLEMLCGLELFLGCQWTYHSCTVEPDSQV
jgi:hypothetical protein